MIKWLWTKIEFGILYILLSERPEIILSKVSQEIEFGPCDDYKTPTNFDDLCFIFQFDMWMLEMKILKAENLNLFINPLEELSPGVM